MTNIIEEAEIINKYLCQLKKSLPLGIRLKKDELNEILDEIEEHIWEKAIENAGDKEPNEIDIQIAIYQMGEPKEIASKFTSRSTPYLYISEELYPYYKKYRKILFWSSILSFILLIFLYSTFIPWWLFYSIQLFELFFLNNFIILLVIHFTFFVFISIIFCYLSITGYIPYELRKSKMQQKYSNLTQIQKPKFKSQFQIFVLRLEISFLLLSAIFLTFWGGFYVNHIGIILFFLLILKCLRGTTKIKTVIWQKCLIILDVFLMAYIILFAELEYYLLFNYQKFFYILSFFWVVLLLYVFYELYLFTNFDEKLEFFLKELSLIKRINKKEIILRSIKSNNSSYSQNIPVENRTFTTNDSALNYEFEKGVKNYIKKAKRKLPFWLKKREKQEVMKNIEEEIRESALEFEESGKYTRIKLKQFFAELGSINTVLSEYKQRGTPKIYISKELWNWYLNALKAILSYFLILSGFIVFIQIKTHATFTIINVLSIFSTFWFLWILLLIFATQFFAFLSINDFIPGKDEFLKSKKNIRLKDQLYYIWETLFAEIYVIFGISLIFVVFSGKFNANFPGSTLILISSVFLLLLGGIKTLKILFKRNKSTLKSFLIALSLIFSLIIIFIYLYNSTSNYPVIYSPRALKLLNSLILPINIEIIYEFFHFFFKNKKKKIILS